MSLGDFIVVFDKKNAIDTNEYQFKALRWPEVAHTQPAVTVEIINDNVLAAMTSDVVLKQQEGKSLICLSQSPESFSTSGCQLDSLFQGLDAQSETVSKLSNFPGKFVAVFWDENNQQLSIATDPVRTYPLYLFENNSKVIVSTDLRLIKGVEKGLEVDPKAIYHHLNFSYIPTPYTIYKEVSKVPPGTRIDLTSANSKALRYWKPDYPEDLEGTEDKLADSLEEQIVAAVLNTRPESQEWGAFLSGGTDSSSISGVLAKNAKPEEKVKTFSIGFDEKGYDELEFSDIASKAFGTLSHKMSVGAEDTLAAIPELVKAFDEPFGNSSAIPTYYCSKLAKDNGLNTLLGGDGGDEIYGGNERYAKDKIFHKYYSLPGIVKLFGTGIAKLLGPIDIRFFNRVKNFVNRASLPNPDRFYLDDSFASEFYDELLSDSFKSKVAKDDSLEVIRNVYQDASAKSELHKLMYVDMQMAISDNDLSKVNRSAKQAGISVLYPYLNPTLVQHTGRISADLKVKDLNKRYLFKKAVRNILPKEILTKKKQGFGLPISVWFRTNPKFIALIDDVLLSEKALARGYFNSDFIKNMVSRHQKGAWDYGAEIWILLMLELWHREYVDV
ncbi:asparagine synthetase B family protein [Aliikangiella sp. IMCC44359]|uniref:asparagine synthetase B family protein n=1 Tax=Aliikangiella sp. IMCC44359 TaxID=3459125 RepID=UPI00403A8368